MGLVSEPKNPGGNMGSGACLFIDDKEVLSYSSFVPAQYSNSNNVAEYMGFERIIDYLIENNITNEVVHIYGDSKLVINQMTHIKPWKIKSGFYVKYAERCLVKLKENFNRQQIFLSWIPRTKNSYADELSKGELIKHNVEFKIQPNEYR